MAVSTASDPPLVRKTRLPGTGASATSRSASSSARGLEKRSKQWWVSSSPSWRVTASTTSRRAWPTSQCQSEAMAST